MAAVSTVLIASAAVAAAGTAYSVHQQNKAADAQEKAEKIAQGQSRIDQQNNRRQQIRQERIRRAQILQGSENSGVAGGSGEVGSISAMQSITGSNVASSFQADRTSARLTSLSQASRNAQQRAATGQAVAGLGGTVFQSLGGAPALMDQFNAAPAASSGVAGGTRNMNRGPVM